MTFFTTSVYTRRPSMASIGAGVPRARGRNGEQVDEAIEEGVLAVVVVARKLRDRRGDAAGGVDLLGVRIAQLEQAGAQHAAGAAGRQDVSDAAQATLRRR